MIADALRKPMLSADPWGPALGAAEAQTCLARREADPANPEPIASLAAAFGTSEGQVALALCRAVKARAERWAREAEHA